MLSPSCNAGNPRDMPSCSYFSISFVSRLSRTLLKLRIRMLARARHTLTMQALNADVVSLILDVSEKATHLALRSSCRTCLQSSRQLTCEKCANRLHTFLLAMRVTVDSSLQNYRWLLQLYFEQRYESPPTKVVSYRCAKCMQTVHELGECRYCKAPPFPWLRAFVVPVLVSASVVCMSYRLGGRMRH